MFVHEICASVGSVDKLFKLICEISNNKTMLKKDYDDFFEIKYGVEVVYKLIDSLDPKCERRLNWMHDIIEKAHAASIAACDY